MCGDEAAAARSMLQISYPVSYPQTSGPVPAFPPVVAFEIQFSDRGHAGIDGEWYCEKMG